MPQVFLSDHQPFLVTTSNLCVFSLNIMFKMRYNSALNFFNNGFNGSNENDSQYYLRLEMIGMLMGQNLMLNNTDVFCLQECPQSREEEEKFKSIVSFNLGKSFQIETSQGRWRGYYEMTVFNTRRFEKHNNLSEQVYRVALTDGFRGRVFPIVLLEKTSQQTYLIINTHGNFNQEIKNDITTLLEAKVRFKIDHLMFVGDFNRNLCIDNDDKVDNCKRDFTMALRQGQFPELKVVAAPRTCVYFADTGLEIQTRDGAVVSNSMGNPEVLTLWQMNRVDILTTKLGVSYAAEAQVTPEIVAALSLAHKKPLSDVVMSQEIPALPMFDAGTVSQNVLDGSIGSDTHDSTTGGQQKRMRKSMAGDESRASDESPAVAGLNQFFPPVAAASSISSGHQAQANF